MEESALADLATDLKEMIKIMLRPMFLRAFIGSFRSFSVSGSF